MKKRIKGRNPHPDRRAKARKQAKRLQLTEKISRHVRIELARLSRESLMANFPRKVLSKKMIEEMPNDVAIELSNQHMRAFLGMDRTNIFTRNK